MHDMTDTSPFNTLMEQGSALHAAGHPEQALVSFEKALAIDGTSLQAANACATLLSEVGQAQAAFQVLLPLRAQLMQEPGGATNFAIAAESVGRLDEARAAYLQALTLDGTQIRARNNLALMQAQAGDWNAAIDGLKACRDQQPDNGALWLNLIDTQIAARRFAQALDTLVQAMLQFPGAPELMVRQAIALAFDGQIESAQAAMDRLAPPAQTMLADLVAGANRTDERLNRKPASAHPDAYELFCQQAFEAMQVCDWRDHERLAPVLRELLARAARTGQGRDWRDAQLCGHMLSLREDEMAQMRLISIDTIAKRLPTPMAPYRVSRSRSRDDRVHVGLAIQTLRDARVANALQRQLALHDHTRFAIHVYSPTPQADPAVTRRMAQQGAGAIEIAHLTDDEAVGRIRLDELDIFVDMAFNSPWCRPEIPERRVAPIQIRQTTWHRHHPPRPCDYNMSDTFVHPDSLDLQAYGAVVRLPHTCWLATNDDQPDAAPPDRAVVGLPADALVLCAFVPALMIDPLSFGLWMKMLRALPHAVLWLPPYAAAARNNLLTAASAAGIDAARLVFQPTGTRAQTLSQLQVSDLFIDTVRFNANQGLVDALRMGVPAVTCAGQSMASRLGGSIVRAAGLPDNVAQSHSAFVDTVVQLGNDNVALEALRARLAHQRASAPLFDPQARVREWESAWETMVQRHRAGQGPAAFDVAAQSPTAVTTAVRV
jgi:protein O-GlcNAc transferase